eukprot:2537661-Lingulodinium_polyedra.AAC.1
MMTPGCGWQLMRQCRGQRRGDENSTMTSRPQTAGRDWRRSGSTAQGSSSSKYDITSTAFQKYVHPDG